MKPAIKVMYTIHIMVSRMTVKVMVNSNAATVATVLLNTFMYNIDIKQCRYRTLGYTNVT